MALLAPYNASMKLGSVIRDDKAPDDEFAPTTTEGGVSQQVSYKTTMIDKISDVTNALNISAAMSIKYDSQIDGTGQGDFLNSDKIKSSTISYLISVKVVNQTITDRKLNKFWPVDGVAPGDFTEVYGDCFISGFQEGGEFNALISIKKSDTSNIHNFGVNAEIALTGMLDGKLEGSANGDVQKARKELLENNEVTISVSWKGGGQKLKGPDEDWTFDTLRKAAVKFPDYVAQTPMRTHIILTKYTSLRSFLPFATRFSPMVYENAGGYTTMLQEAFADYKNLAKYIQTLAIDFDAGKTILKESEMIGARDRTAFYGKLITAANAPSAESKSPASDTGNQQLEASKEKGVSGEGKKLESESGKAEEVASQDGADTPEEHEDDPSPELNPPTAQGTNEPADSTKSLALRGTSAKASAGKLPKPREPLYILKPYEATLLGLEKAKRDIRLMMNRIVSEVDVVTHYPTVATDETWPMPFMSPILFKQFLPVPKPVEDKQDE
ncbi:hypothetical protein PFICI_06501 [Pestalotiopsis fici W106-1]|uniref:Uncharacterized protein n=1 Tax=Pestalotiopsis fici (strain W106-1 / CGMCC3.15140) TaxID=1229662 RepID=W3X636_PESFW|nr:uncharacterized protein PFICI_06501 [Pestalotiopsis fici W106-1]ETS81499.1 hypothetical protein PFICI_06501 [Pestalotiopsis fici W106-1]